LKRTTLWLSWGLPVYPNSDPCWRGTNQRNSSPALGRALASAQIAVICTSGAELSPKYLAAPAQTAAPRQRASKLDPFKPAIAEFLEQDAHAPATVIAQRLRQLGFSGGLSILKEYLHRVRAQASAKRAYVRMEPGPGERFEVDWDTSTRFSTGACTKTLRLLSSGMSQPQAVSGVHPQPELRDFCSLSSHAFRFMGGIARELWFDNLATAVAEH